MSTLIFTLEVIQAVGLAALIVAIAIFMMCVALLAVRFVKDSDTDDAA